MTTVFVWQNRFTGSGHTWTGHASMNITDTYIDNRPLELKEGTTNTMQPNSESVGLTQGTIDHVSFWPGSGGNFADGWKPGIKFAAKTKPSLFADVALETYAPDHVIRIKGLNILKMGSKWQSIRNKQDANYRFLRKNCSTIVARVLGAAVPWHSRPHHLVWTPCDVRDFAFKYGEAITWDAFLTEMEKQLVASKEQVAFLRQVKRRSAARGTSGAEAKFK